MRKTKIKTIGALLVLALLMLVSACRSGKFTLNAEMKGLGNQRVRVVYVDANGSVVDTWVDANKDIFVVEGTCASPSLMVVYNSMNVPMFKTVVSSGDKIEISGKVLEPYELEMKGSEVVEQWSAFIKEHKREYQMLNSPTLNSTIEKYVKEHPKSMVSTLLVLVDYAPASEAQADRLLDMIDKSAKPASLMESYNTQKMRAVKPVDTLRSLNMLELQSQDFETAVLTGSKPSVILFWDKSMGDQVHTQSVAELQMLDATMVNILDVNVESDSAGWNAAIKKDGTQWKHYWVPGSVMNSTLLPLRITATPTVIVTDSTGHIIFRGDDAVKARQTIENL